LAYVDVADKWIQFDDLRERSRMQQTQIVDTLSGHS
jgi:hypothetical protein